MNSKISDKFYYFSLEKDLLGLISISKTVKSSYLWRGYEFGKVYNKCA